MKMKMLLEPLKKTNGDQKEDIKNPLFDNSKKSKIANNSTYLQKQAFYSNAMQWNESDILEKSFNNVNDVVQNIEKAVKFDSSISYHNLCKLFSNVPKVPSYLDGEKGKDIWATILFIAFFAKYGQNFDDWKYIMENCISYIEGINLEIDEYNLIYNRALSEISAISPL